MTSSTSRAVATACHPSKDLKALYWLCQKKWILTILTIQQTRSTTANCKSLAIPPNISQQPPQDSYSMTNGTCRNTPASRGPMDDTMLCMRRSAMQGGHLPELPQSMHHQDPSAEPPVRLTTQEERDQQRRRYLVSVLEQALAILDDEDTQFW